MSLTGRCNCGIVKFSVPADVQPQFSALCHCKNCRQMNAASVVHLVGFKPDELKIEGEEHLSKVFISPKLAYTLCKSCGCHISQGPEGAPFVATFPANYDFARQQFPKCPGTFKVSCHMNFENAVCDYLYYGDGLPKFKDFPAAFGGSNRFMNQSYDSLCTIHPTFTILKKDECAEMMKKCVDGTKNEPGCIYYGWVTNGDKLICREAYVDGDATAEHLKNALAIIGPCLEAGVLKVESMLITCGQAELGKFKEISDGVNAEYFIVDSGFSRVQQ